MRSWFFPMDRNVFGTRGCPPRYDCRVIIELPHTRDVTQKIEKIVKMKAADKSKCMYYLHSLDLGSFSTSASLHSNQTDNHWALPT